jgi:Helix-turn-helix domain
MCEDNEEFAILWDFIASDKDLTSSEKILYSIILSLSTTEGYCWATNLQLMEKMGMSETNNHRFNDHMKTLKNGGWIKIEGGTRDRKIYPLKKPIRGQNDPILNPVKKEIRGQNDLTLGVKMTPNPPLPLYKDQNKESKVKHRGDWGKPNPSVHTNQKNTKNEVHVAKKNPMAVLTQAGYYQLRPLMLKGSPPTPGPVSMVNEVKDLLSNQITIGSRRYKIAEEDKAWFFGYSPVVIEKAIGRVHQVSRSGERIENIVAAIYASCGEIRRENEKEAGAGFKTYYR